MSMMRSSNPSGSLLDYAPGFRCYLSELGYSVGVVNKHLYLLTHLSRWLEMEGVSFCELTDSKIEEFFSIRRIQGKSKLRTPRSLEPLITYLGELGVTLKPPILTKPLDVFIERYHSYLTSQRGLAEGTAHFYMYVARLLASVRPCPTEIEWTSLCAQDVTEFSARVCRGRSISSVRQVVSALRCLLRYLRLEGFTELHLDQAVLSVAGRSPSLPRGISSGEVTALLDSCDRETAIGRRDYAILLLLCRFGIRDGEVIGLKLDDIDWKAAEIVINGKGGRRDRLPLPTDVGTALADYLKYARPHATSRFVFLRQPAPIREIGETGAIRAVLERACLRAGISYVNPHRLRHTVATEMLLSGVSLRDIGQVLGHRGEATTANYARVDIDRLRIIARCWPEVVA